MTDNPFYRLFQLSTNPSIVLSPAGASHTIAHVNDAFVRGAGFMPEQLIGQTLTNVFPFGEDEHGQRFTTTLLNALSRLMESPSTFSKVEAPIPFQFPNPSNSTDSFWQTELVPIPDADGRLTHIVVRWEPMPSPVPSTSTEVVQPISPASLKGGNLFENMQLLEANTQTGSWDLNLQTGEIQWSDEFFRICGYEPRSFTPTVDKTNAAFHPDDIKKVIQTHEKVIQEKSNYVLESRIIPPNGRERIVICSGRAILDEQGNVIHLAGTFQDVTATRNLEAQLKKYVDELSRKNDFIESILQHLEVGISVNRISDGHYLFMNEKFIQIAGWTVTEITDIYQFFKKIFPDPGARKKIIGEVNEAMAGNRSEGMQWTNVEIKTASGSKRRIDIKNIPLPDQDQVISTIVDVTSRFEQKEQIIQSRLRLDSMINSTSDLMWTIDRQFNLIASNQAFRTFVSKITGKEPLEGDYILNQAFSTNGSMVWQDYYQKALAGESFTIKKHFFYPIDSGMEYCEITFNTMRNPDGEIAGVACYSKDITDDTLNMLALQNTLQQLEANEEKLNTAKNIAKLGYWELDMRDESLYWSDQLYAIFEQDKAHFNPTTTSFLHCIYPADLANYLLGKTVQLEDRHEYDLEYRIVSGSGMIKWVNEKGKRQLNGMGQSKGMEGTLQDITPQKALAQSLEESNQRYDYVTKATFDAIWDWNLITNKVYWGAGMEEIFGYDCYSITNEHNFWRTRIHPDDAAGVEERLHRVIDGNETHWLEEYRFRKMNNEYVFVADKGIVIRNESGKAVRMIGAMQNIDQRKKEELRLKLLESVITNANDAVIITEAEPFDLPGPRIIYVNEAFTRVTGYLPEEVIGQTPRILQGPKTDFKELDRLSKALRNWESCEINVINYKKNGEPFWNNFSISPVANETGYFTHWIAIQRDITEYENSLEVIKKSNERYNMVALATNDAIWDWDMLNNEVSRTGDGFTELFGYDAIEADSDEHFWVEHVHPDDLEEVVSSRQLVFDDPNEKYWEAEYRFKCSDGRYAMVYDRGYIIRNEEGKAIRMIGATQDVTALREKEIELLALNEQLKQHSKELAISNKELEQFAYVASHDLQEPLRMITSFLTQLERKYLDILDEKGKQYINFAVDGAKRMRRIILDLLEFSRVGQMEEKLEWVNLNEIVEEVVSLYRKEIYDLQAVIKADSLPKLYNFATPIAQVFQNLISNSLKYHQENVIPMIHIEAIDAGEHWEIRVADNAIGIDPEYFEKIFVIFQRLHTKDEYSGTGMGLAITRKIIENLGGRIWVESVEGKGSTFYFTLLKHIKKTQ